MTTGKNVENNGISLGKEKKALTARLLCNPIFWLKTIVNPNFDPLSILSQARKKPNWSVGRMEKKREHLFQAAIINIINEHREMERRKEGRKEATHEYRIERNTMRWDCVCIFIFMHFTSPLNRIDGSNCRAQKWWLFCMNPRGVCFFVCLFTIRFENCLWR